MRNPFPFVRFVCVCVSLCVLTCVYLCLLGECVPNNFFKKMLLHAFSKHVLIDEVKSLWGGGRNRKVVSI